MPGGGIDFGEHPEAGALRELHEETGLRQDRRAPRVDSVAARARRATAPTVELHRIRIIYRTEIIGGDLRDETDESTDMAAWFTQRGAPKLDLIDVGRRSELGALAWNGRWNDAATPPDCGLSKPQERTWVGSTAKLRS